MIRERWLRIKQSSLAVSKASDVAIPADGGQRLDNIPHARSSLGNWI